MGLTLRASWQPTDYELIWNDKKTGAKRHCSIWRPIPPPGTPPWSSCSLCCAFCAVIVFSHACGRA